MGTAPRQIFSGSTTPFKNKPFPDRPEPYLPDGVQYGGGGTFYTAEEYPDLFTAIAPVSGYGDVEKAQRLKTVPIWAFHGDADDIVDYKYSAEMIEAIQKAGNTDARLTTIPGGGHRICPNAYGNPELYRWMLRHKK